MLQLTLALDRVRLGQLAIQTNTDPTLEREAIERRRIEVTASRILAHAICTAELLAMHGKTEMVVCIADAPSLTSEVYERWRTPTPALLTGVSKIVYESCLAGDLNPRLEFSAPEDQRYGEFGIKIIISWGA